MSWITSIFKRLNKYLLLLFIILIAIGILTFIWFVPDLLSNQAKSLDFKERLGIFALIVGGTLLAIGVYLTYRRINTLEKNIRVSEEGQITERFIRAVEQLGSDKLEIRLGGIYTLERIAKYSEKDHWAIMEILSANIREKCQLVKKSVTAENEEIDPVNDKVIAQEPRKTSIDIQSILTVIGRRKYQFDPENSKLDFYAISIYKPILIEAILDGAIFVRAQLEGANFWKAHLKGAFFTSAQLKGAYFIDAELEGAYFTGAQLEGAYFTSAQLERANFISAQLKGAYFINAQLEGAHFTGAQLEGADFTNAQLIGANLKGAQFEGADFKGANLKSIELDHINQFKNVKSLRGAKFDPEVEKAIRRIRHDL